MKNTVSIVEVGPRDGLQNCPEVLSVGQKEALLRHLLDCGFNHIEAGSFVRADRVPQMAASDTLADRLKAQNQKLWYLVPNRKGLESALAHDCRNLAFFTAASESFNTKNIGMDVRKSLNVIRECVAHLKDQGYSPVTDWHTAPQNEREVRLRLYVSTAIGCPYEGPVDPGKVARIVDELMPLGFAQVSLGDTIGVGVPRHWRALLKMLDAELFRRQAVALHCHDTYGTALACVAEGLTHGVRTFDASVGGLGGCPFAPGASGNLATEDLVYFLEQEGCHTGIDAQKLRTTFAPERTGGLVNLSHLAKLATR